MNIILVVFLIVFVFLISYNPSAGTFDKYIPRKEKYESAVPVDRRLTQCSESRYLDLQLGSPGPCAGEPTEYLGAVIHV